MSSSYLLVSHGSRDPRPQQAMAQLAMLVSQIASQTEASVAPAGLQPVKYRATSSQVTPPLARQQPLVGTACLELGSAPLHQQMIEFADRTLSSGGNCLQVVPLFLLSGMHVKQDLPAEVAMAQKICGQKLQIDLRPHLGSHPQISQLLAKQIAIASAAAWILLAHGSRRAGSQQPIAALAQQLGAVPAYWAVSPSLESRVRKLADRGIQQIAIVPYFLFAGGITDAIAQKVEQLQTQFPEVNLQLSEPLGASAELANMVWDLVA